MTHLSYGDGMTHLSYRRTPVFTRSESARPADAQSRFATVDPGVRRHDGPEPE
jgi:hypothetical protein